MGMHEETAHADVEPRLRVGIPLLREFTPSAFSLFLVT